MLSAGIPIQPIIITLSYLGSSGSIRFVIDVNTVDAKDLSINPIAGIIPVFLKAILLMSLWW